MNDTCRAFRIEWLLAKRAGDAHVGLCSSCADWLRSTERQIRALSQLERLAVPPELDLNLERELAGDRSRRLMRTLGSLVREGAPAALDERVAAFFDEGAGVGDEERGERSAQAARALDVHPAPGVLERLLEEELQSPEKQRVERFSGSLERLHAPEALGDRLESTVRRKALLRLTLGPLATLVAAALVVWFAVRHGGDSPCERRFQVIQASSLDGIDPLARMLAEALSGGAGGPR